MSNNAQHVYFLQKKKAEILARKEREKAALAAKHKPPGIKAEPSHQLQFANDGSFLERFKMMQKHQQIEPQVSHLSAVTKQEAIDIHPGTSKDLAGSEKQSWKAFPAKSQSELKLSTSIFEKHEEEGISFWTNCFVPYCFLLHTFFL